ncbi:PC-esterase domain-containing protein 1A isoform X2 [Anabrus simplex]|uniref:PC-esterase domain-containing protein 1A isoform X2 n=1 Tax=Anabrus simplex TaxID=316456 RepID=UPI0034DD786A
MCDIFTKKNAKELLRNKYIVFLGDSNIRAIYKDLLWLLNFNTLITNEALKRKLEQSFAGDRLQKGRILNRGRDYTEVREFKSEGVHAEFHFITRCYSKDIEEMVHEWKKKPLTAPDVIVINSCLWDISRWGPNGVPEYKDNLVKLMKLFKSCLPERTLVVWVTVPPLSNKIRGGLLIHQVEFMQHTLRFEVMEANTFARQVVVPHGFDILDIHYYLRMQILGRAPDGIHWLPIPMRHITNLLLTHICLSWNYPLPGNFSGPSLERFKKLATEEKKPEVVLPPLPPAVSQKNKTPKKTVLTPFRKSKAATKVAASPLRKAIKEKLGKTKFVSSPDKEKTLTGASDQRGANDVTIYTLQQDNVIEECTEKKTVNSKRGKQRRKNRRQAHYHPYNNSYYSHFGQYLQYPIIWFYP